MIYARNSEAGRYMGIHPRLDAALALLNDGFLSGVGSERVELEGQDLYCTRFTYETVPDEQSLFESHLSYLDIHVMVEGSERVEIAPPDGLELVEDRPDGDIRLFRGRGRQTLILSPGEFLVVFPDDAHRLKLRTGSAATVSKAVFKVRLYES